MQHPVQCLALITHPETVADLVAAITAAEVVLLLYLAITAAEVVLLLLLAIMVEVDRHPHRAIVVVAATLLQPATVVTAERPAIARPEFKTKKGLEDLVLRGLLFF